ncbi:uncharacterized protein LOC106661825 [Cimex lectularius]|uniref:Uncharacterized protein n=1 Tax=Cimex lectularius TaxID=79782 RepID=A0A8I6RBX1_CIMLE|nr:uncharacterized protein LOC106661825 [Cimex lectularius]
MQIPTARPDLDGGDGISSGDEHSFAKQTSPIRTEQKNADQSQTSAKAERPAMPPELIVTSTQGNDLNVFERLYKAAEISRSGQLALSKSSSRRGSYRKISPVRPRRKLVRQSGELSDPECRSSEVKMPIRQHFWRVLSSDNLPWSCRKDEHEQILKACSQKLAELKKKHKIKIKEKIEIDAVKAPLKRKVKRRPNMGIERMTTISFEHVNIHDSMRVKPFRQVEFKKPEEEPLRKSIKKVPNRKFRKGGIVSLTTVHANNTEASGDESVENSSTSKKKKKKRKLLQLPKSVKSAVSAVTAVTTSTKKGRKDASAKKN